MDWLGYAWKVLVNIFYCLVVLVVLFSSSDPFRREVFAVLGLIYTTMRSVAISQAITFAKVSYGLEKKIDHISYQVDSTFEKPDYVEANDLLKRVEAKLYIDIFGLAVISLLCFAAFFTAR